MLRRATLNTSSLCRRSVARFARDEDGTLLMFGLYLFLLMVMLGGLAVDLMRYEQRRVALQQTLDRSVLAAASLTQDLDAEAVVRDYFTKAGLIEFLKTVRVTEDDSFRSVEATAELELIPFFTHMVGINEFLVPAAGSAVQRRDQVEISLVLDISGSMRDSNRIANMRLAATEFVTTVLANDAADTTSINLVPYAGQTNPGPDLFAYLGGTRTHNKSSCIQLNSADFNSDTLPSGARTQVPHFMHWANAPAFMDWGWCPTDNASILVGQNNPTTLNTYINNIRLHDGTGTQNGLKYGVALLNPSSRAAFTHLIGKGKASSQFAGRPMAYDEPESLKVVVLMTDGQITEQVLPKNPSDPQNATKELQPRGTNYYNTPTSASQNVTSFYSMCNLAKADGIVIYTIAFEAPGAAQTQMRTCASGSTYYFNVSGLDIQKAFRAIASNISQLRLTQ